MTTLRCSSLPLIARCGAAAVSPRIEIASGGPEADLGTAVHEAKQAIVRGWAYDLDEMAERYAVDRDTLGMLVWRLREWWNEYRAYFPNAEAERELQAYWPTGSYSLDEDVLLTGHIDLLSINGDEAAIADTKSGFLDTPADDQLRGYVLLVFENYPEVQKVWTGVVRLRGRTCDGATYTREQIEAWWQSILAKVLDRKFNPGPHCGFCPLSLECPAKTALLQQAASALVPDGHRGELSIGTLFDRLKLLQRFVEDTLTMVKAEVVSKGGRVPLGDGRALVINEQNRRSLDAMRARSVLKTYLAPEAIDRSSTLALGKIEKELRATATGHNRPKNPAETAVAQWSKGEFVKSVMAELEAAGALTTKTVPILEVTHESAGEDADAATAANEAETAARLVDASGPGA